MNFVGVAAAAARKKRRPERRRSGILPQMPGLLHHHRQRSCRYERRMGVDNGSFEMRHRGRRFAAGLMRPFPVPSTRVQARDRRSPCETMRACCPQPRREVQRVARVGPRKIELAGALVGVGASKQRSRRFLPPSSHRAECRGVQGDRLCGFTFQRREPGFRNPAGVGRRAPLGQIKLPAGSAACSTASASATRPCSA